MYKGVASLCIRKRKGENKKIYMYLLVLAKDKSVRGMGAATDSGSSFFA